MKRIATGKVCLVGAGPGDPQLITVKGLEYISKADVIIYDRLVNDKLLQAARPEAEQIYVGKSPSGHTMSQSEINNLLVSKAKEGKLVVRLKGGDPFIFGRGGEEAESLSAEDIQFEIVPGVSSATAVPAYAGIPVTHRSYASSVCIITGHEDPAKAKSTIDWNSISTGADTLVFLMGMENLPQIVDRLLSSGRPPSTPVAVIQEGAGPRQKAVTGTLSDIITKSVEYHLEPPAVIIVGSVVELRDRLRWFDNQPLFGKRVLVTRAGHQAGRLSDLLAQQGAEPVPMAAIAIEPVSDYRKLDKAINELSDYDWIIFTSTNGVDVFFSRLLSLGKDSRELKGVKVCAIGPVTAGATEQRGIMVDYVPREYISKGIADGFSAIDINNSRILLPRASEAGPELVIRLKQLGARVDDITTYRTVLPSNTDTQGKKMLIEGMIDITTFTSSSTVRNTASLLGKELYYVNNTTVACIGPTTAATAAELGLKVDVIAEEFTIVGLVEAIVKHY